MKVETQEFDKDKFDSVMQIVNHIGEHERHFNTLETDYRKLSSTWLLAALGASGYVLKTDTVMPFDRWYLVLAICIAASIGLGILWMMDIKVYHRLLHAFFKEGMKLEIDYSFLRPIRINMAKSQETGDVVTKIQYYYFISIVLLLGIAGIAIFNLKDLAEFPGYKFLFSGVIVLVVIYILVRMIPRKSRPSEVRKLIEKYDRLHSSHSS